MVFLAQARAHIHTHTYTHTHLQAQHQNLKEQINKIGSDYSTQCHIRVQRRQQRKIATHPAHANKKILSGKSTTPSQIQALTDPSTGEVETDP
eukprot:293077-Pelagomonas_calceolata.AAC.1